MPPSSGLRPSWPAAVTPRSSRTCAGCWPTIHCGKTCGCCSCGPWTGPGATPRRSRRTARRPAAGTVRARGRPAAPAGAGPPVARSVPVPAQLPADVSDFTGREDQIKHLCDLLASGGTDADPGAGPIALVAGSGGLGKTSLAVHAAHRARGSFPDGQLYVDLLGATPQPLTPAAVLGRV